MSETINREELDSRVPQAEEITGGFRWSLLYSPVTGEYFKVSKGFGGYTVEPGVLRYLCGFWQFFGEDGSEISFEE